MVYIQHRHSQQKRINKKCRHKKPERIYHTAILVFFFFFNKYASHPYCLPFIRSSLNMEQKNDRPFDFLHDLVCCVSVERIDWAFNRTVDVNCVPANARRLFRVCVCVLRFVLFVCFFFGLFGIVLRPISLIEVIERFLPFHTHKLIALDIDNKYFPWWKQPALWLNALSNGFELIRITCLKWCFLPAVFFSSFNEFNINISELIVVENQV